MPASYAKFRGVNLPQQFSYRLPSPPTRHETIQTCGGVVIHDAGEVADGDALIEWSCQAIDQNEWAQLLYWRANDAANGSDFIGYWGDHYKVRFLEMRPTRAYAAGLFDVEGTFQIMSTIAWGEYTDGTDVS